MKEDWKKETIKAVLFVLLILVVGTLTVLLTDNKILLIISGMLIGTIDRIFDKWLDKNLYMQGYEQALKDINLDKFFQEGYIYGIEVENKNFIRNLEEFIYELKEKREKGSIVIGYWQIKNMIEEIIKQCKIN